MELSWGKNLSVNYYQEVKGIYFQCPLTLPDPTSCIFCTFSLKRVLSYRLDGMIFWGSQWSQNDKTQEMTKKLVLCQCCNYLSKPYRHDCMSMQFLHTTIFIPSFWEFKNSLGNNFNDLSSMALLWNLFHFGL